MDIEFDPAKRDVTLRERGLDFADAAMVFAGRVVTVVDDRLTYGEVRYVTYAPWLSCGPNAALHAGLFRCGVCMNGRSNMSDWIDPDDAPELTEEMLDVAEFSIGGKVIRAATGYLGPNGVVRGRPPLRDRAKEQVTLRLDPDVVARFREGGPGWQGRINAALRVAVGL